MSELHYEIWVDVENRVGEMKFHECDAMLAEYMANDDTKNINTMKSIMDLPMFEKSLILRGYMYEEIIDEMEM